MMLGPLESKKLGAIALTLVFAAAVTGFVTGARAPLLDPVRRERAAPNASERAPNYVELRELRRGLNAEMYAGAIASLASPTDLFGEFQQTEKDREQALAVRRTRRAFDGAPPTIPHAISQLGPPACLSCHEYGARLDGKIARRPSHTRHEACTQCHVVSNGPVPGQPVTPIAPNIFVGLESPTRGERAWPGAPPTIPHSTWMRSECTSCHGTTGALGMRSTHPWRQSCLQCHAPSAVLDQRQPVALGAPP
jgi:nitrate reductase (cytochrome), electron transfer subunit